MSCFVYILGCEGRTGWRTYVGWTTDLDRRLAQHNAGTGARSTRGYEWQLLYAERHATRGDAMGREWRLKRDRRFRRSLTEVFAPSTPHPLADARDLPLDGGGRREAPGLRHAEVASATQAGGGEARPDVTPNGGKR